MAENISKVLNTHKSHKIILEERNKLGLTGVERVDNASPTQFSCVVNGVVLHIQGENLEVIKLDVEQGCVELAGQVNSINYAGEKKSFIKRLFK